MALDVDLGVFRAAAAQIGSLRGARGEQSLYGPFDVFLGAAAASLGHLVQPVQQVGVLNLVPDFGLFRGGDVVNWVELKAPGKDLDSLTGHDARQHERALENLSAFVLTNGWDWRYYVDGALERAALLPDNVLSDPQEIIPANAMTDLEELLDLAIGRTPLPVASVDEAVELLARRARAIRRAVNLAMETQPGGLLQGLFDEFRGLVYASGRVFRNDDFADAYAQTTVFGLLLGLTNSGIQISTQNAGEAIGAVQHPFLSRCLGLLTDTALPPDVQGPVREAVTAVNRIPPDLFRGVSNSQPILYAYESFFAAYDSSERAARGVYYTPKFIVDHQVLGIQTLLRESFGLDGLSDQRVNYLDPATGTGTFLLGLLEKSQRELDESGAAVDVEIESLVSERLHAFELMIGPYGVAHQRLSTYLLDHGVDYKGRLPIYLVDTLAEVLTGEVQSRFGALGEELADERAEAERIKREEPVLVIYGNPPYDRIRRGQLGDEWLLELLDDLRDRTPRGDRANLKALYDYYVAFWRWAFWLVNERNLPSGETQGRAIIAFITNRSWLVGRAFGGLRSLVSDMSKQVWVLDLGGDMRSSHTRLRDQNVFDVGVGVAITFVVIDSDAPELPEVFYRRVWGGRREKQVELGEGFQASSYSTVARSEPTAPFVPIDWGRLSTSPDLEQVFQQAETGVQTSRPWLIGLSREDVLDVSGARPTGSVGDWSLLEGIEREESFHTTRTHPLAPQDPVSVDHLTRYAYRPLDYRTVYNDPDYVEWPRPTLQQSFANQNWALVTLERGFGLGPAAFPVDALPDLHVFRGFAGARGIYPLYGGPNPGQQTLGTDPERAPNVSPSIVDWADSVLGNWDPEDIMAYAIALLGAPSYTVRFEGGLAVERPRVPFTNDPDLAAEVVETGRALIDAWLLQEPARDEVRWDQGGTTNSTFGDACWDAGRLAVAGRYLEGISEDVWNFRVSGYAVLPKYCADRRDAETSALAMAEMRRVASCLKSVVESGTDLDDTLDRVLQSELLLV